MEKMRTRTWKGMSKRRVGKIQKYTAQSCNGTVTLMMDVPKQYIPANVDTMCDWKDRAMIELYTTGKLLENGDIACNLSDGQQTKFVIPYREVGRVELSWLEAA